MGEAALKIRLDVLGSPGVSFSTCHAGHCSTQFALAQLGWMCCTPVEGFSR
jgi:hypothetical protein